MGVEPPVAGRSPDIHGVMMNDLRVMHLQALSVQAGE